MIGLHRILFVALLPSVCAALTDAPNEYRSGPVSIVVREDAILVAGRLSGVVSVLDAEASKVVDTFPTGRILGGLASVSGTDYLLAPAENTDEVLLLRWRNRRLDRVASAKVPGTPVQATASPDGRWVAVSALWGRSVSVFRLEKGALHLQKRVELPFSPRLQWWSPGGAHLVVVDSYGGQLAVLDAKTFSVVSVRHTDASGVRGVLPGLDGRSLLLVHNRVNPSNPTTQPMVFYGFVVSSGVLMVDLDDLLRPSRDPQVRQFGFHPLGDVKAGAADPGQIQFLGGGGFAVCLGGVGEVAVGDSLGGEFSRIEVGRRPVALAESADGLRLLVANYFDDNIAVMDLATRKVLRHVRLCPPPAAPTVQRRGEVLFYDAKLGLHGWSSCHSCHVDGHSTGGLADTLGDGTVYTPKRIPSLFGTSETGPWGWDGAKSNLHEQILQSMRITMQGSEMKMDTPENVAFLVSYLRTLKAPPAGTAHLRGREVFENLGCADCHAPPTYTSDRAYDVGVQDENGHSKFNPPSLRGLRHRRHFFHDNRAVRLEDVFTHHKHPDGESPTGEELRNLLLFLRGL